MFVCLLCFVGQQSRRPDSGQGVTWGSMVSVMPKVSVPCDITGAPAVQLKPGDYVEVEVSVCLALRLAFGPKKNRFT